VLAFWQRAQQTGAVPKSITIRDVPDETSEELAARAALTGRSLQEYLRARLVELASAPDAEAWMARVRARKMATGGSITIDQVLAQRDADRT
jgi:antitoxin FitA